MRVYSGMLYQIDQSKLQYVFVMRVYSGMLYLIDQSKLQYIFCYEGLQWYVIFDRSVKVTVYFLF